MLSDTVAWRRRDDGPVTRRPSTSPRLPWNSRELQDGVRTIAVHRVAAVPVLALAGVLQPQTVLVPFAILCVLGILAELYQLRVLYSDGWMRLPLPALLFLDVAMLAAAVALTGGAQSPIAYIGLLAIFPATYAFGPVYMARMCAFLLVTVGGVVVHDAIGEGDGGAIATFLGAVLLLTIICVNAARVREAASTSLRDLADARRRLVADAASAEALDRRRISQQLHDAALQSLLAARQDLDEVAAGDADSLQYARDAVQRSVDTVRDLVYDIDPAALAGTRLPDALRGLVERLELPDHLEVHRTIASDAGGDHDVLLHAVARQLLRHATAQPEATRVTVVLRREAGVVHLEVTDNGRRLEFDDHEEGTVGIAAAAARVAAAGARLAIQRLEDHGTRREDHGTRIVVMMPDGNSATPQPA